MMRIALGDRLYLSVQWLIIQICAILQVLAERFKLKSLARKDTIENYGEIRMGRKLKTILVFRNKLEAFENYELNKAEDVTKRA